MAVKVCESCGMLFKWRFFLYLVVLMMLVVTPFPASSTTTMTSSNQRFVNISGDFILGALFPIHRRGDSEMCGEIQPEDGIQPLEALLYTIDKINRNDSLLPGIRLGVLALDTCDSNIYAMEQSMIFMKSLISHYNEYHETEFQCSDGSAAKFRNGNFDRIVGVIGGQSSSVTIQVSSIFLLSTNFLSSNFMLKSPTLE
ncbi:unnamed protein product [Orchesella dallaii]|uniref:Receptor ligand binding region domain-containing protein n=1 Tax=Orchesella dallaii TaxID=48710 RepID=A0ABP1RXL7_9HEXA